MHYLIVTVYKFEKVKEFKCLRTIITADNKISKEINDTLA